MPYDIIIGRDKEDKKRFGKKGLIYIGKGYVKMGNYTSLSNKIWLDVARSHVILISGKRGSGKCLHGDTLINLSDGSLVPIKELENKKEKVISLNNKLKIEESEKREFFSRKVNKLLKIKLRSGKEIKLTPEHPLLTIKGWKPVQDLKVGSRIATPRITPSFGTNTMQEHEIKLLAYLIAKGHTKKVVFFSNSDEKIVKEFKDFLKKFDSSLELIEEKAHYYRISCPTWKTKIIDKSKIKFNREKRYFEKGSKVIRKKRSIRKLLEKHDLYNKLAAEKTIPKEVLTLKKEQLSMFLNRLFSCDGSIYKHRTRNGEVWQISYSSSSEKLIRQIQSLLLRYGIFSRLRGKKIKCRGRCFNSFELVFGSNNILKFIEHIGFFGRKQNREKEAINHICSKIRNPDIDTIPREIWETYKPKNWADIGNINYKYLVMREQIRYAPSRGALLQIVEAEQNNPLKLLATSDIFWDEIISIELLEGDFTVYDICVPEHHNFVANDIIVHNSYSISVLAEELSNLPKETRKNIAPLIFDTMGIFWTMKYKNEKEIGLLEDWGLKPKNLPTVVWIPLDYFEEFEKRGILVDKKFALLVPDLDIEDWLSIFELKITEPLSILIQKVISELKNKNYDLDDIIGKIKEDKEADDRTKKATISLFEAAKSWGFFAKKNQQATKINELIQAGKTTILDLSVYPSTSTFNVRALIIGLVSRKLFNHRMLARKKEEVESIQRGVGSHEEKKEMPLVWLMLDEAHEFLPKNEKTPATNSLIQLLREGRQPGISLVLATQQPGVIHRDVMTQSDVIISHRLTNKRDIEALNEIMQTYMLESIQKSMRNLPDLKGSALILDDNSERLYSVRIRPKLTWHGGEAPIAIEIGEE